MKTQIILELQAIKERRQMRGRVRAKDVDWLIGEIERLREALDYYTDDEMFERDSLVKGELARDVLGRN